MSVQFGRWNFDGRPCAPEYCEKVSSTLADYGPDSNEKYAQGGMTILYRAFHTTKESHREKQPHVSPSGAVITWDGRLDNRKELIFELGRPLAADSPDVAIVAAAYQRWGADCLRRLVGDWALSVWNPRERYVLLTKDAIGTKPLYYFLGDNHLIWSTLLDPLVLFSSRPFEIDTEYVAGWFSHTPAAHLTPYEGIRGVPPSSFVLLGPGKPAAIRKYWDFDPGKKIRYRTDAEYEEHFRSALATAVQRRLRSDRPILAELSGGLDSSSIVCLADDLIARGQADCPRLDTISWYDDSYDHLEPDSNELHWIKKVEERRGKTGHHINQREQKKEESEPRKSFTSELKGGSFAVTPSNHRRLSEFYQRYASVLKAHAYRVTLSGMTGEMATGGGIPTPTPELQNYLARARFITLSRQLKAWATKMRGRRLPLLWEAILGFLPLRFTDGRENPVQGSPWFRDSFVRRNREALLCYPRRLKLFGPLPSFQDHLIDLEGERRILAHWPLLGYPELYREVRLPYVDRDLLEFVYAIPREKIVRVGMRRALMRRALVGIVPDELLNRKRKFFVPPDANPQQQKPDVAAEWSRFDGLDFRQMVSGSIGLLDPEQFRDAIDKARSNGDGPGLGIVRIVELELWLRHLAVQGLLAKSPLHKPQPALFSPRLREGHSWILE
ncbi:MAG: hypothetical protein DMG38_05450 [Acidobacteria bacterium]|nr:MAG: hypothetical protein DMG38_05450 [Acidobacteriota bacterium]